MQILKGAKRVVYANNNKTSEIIFKIKSTVKK